MRALELTWDPIFDYFREKCEGFSEFCNLTFKKSQFQGMDFLYYIFLIVVPGVLEDFRPVNSPCLPDLQKCPRFFELSFFCFSETMARPM